MVVERGTLDWSQRYFVLRNACSGRVSANAHSESLSYVCIEAGVSSSSSNEGRSEADSSRDLTLLLHKDVQEFKPPD